MPACTFCLVGAKHTDKQCEMGRRAVEDFEQGSRLYETLVFRKWERDGVGKEDEDDSN